MLILMILRIIIIVIIIIIIIITLNKKLTFKIKNSWKLQSLNIVLIDRFVKNIGIPMKIMKNIQIHNYSKQATFVRNFLSC